MSTRPWTPTRRDGDVTAIPLKRNCNGCGRALGDVAAAELDWSQPLPDVREECRCNWEQPPGIDEDSHDMPRPTAAAERVLEFVKDFGDGRVTGHPDLPGVEPLYARDLEALARAFLAALVQDGAA